MIPLIDLRAQYHSLKPEIDQAVQEVLESGHFILGPNVNLLEQEIAQYLGVRHAVGLASGTDALLIALRALDIGPGDEVIIPAYTFFATAGAVLTTGAKPIFVDIDPATYSIQTAENALEGVLSSRTKAIIPVHLYGHPAPMREIQAFAQAHHLSIIEDNAQAFGAEYFGQKTGGLGNIGCLSFFPTKNLGASGDAGMVVTNDDQLAEKMRMLRTHGWKRKYYPEMIGYNSRLDELQAAILRVKLRHLDEWNDRRRVLAAAYCQALSLPGVRVPTEAPGVRHVYHLFVARFAQRDLVQQKLRQAGIASEVYYPQPPHLTLPGRQLGYGVGDFFFAEEASAQTLAIPFYPELSADLFNQVVGTLGTILSEVSKDFK